MMSLISVDLPQPLGPRSTVVRLGEIVKSIEFTAFVEPYAFETSSSLIMGLQFLFTIYQFAIYV
jgi:hypothetical protein